MNSKIAIVFSLFLLITVRNIYPQPHPDIGTFDIDKVARAVGSQDTSLTPESGHAASVSSGPAGKVNENWIMVGFRIGLYLVLTIAAIFLVIWGIKRIGLAGRSRIGGGSMDLLEALPLGQNRTIVLVRVVDKVYLIGQTPNQITVLETIEGQKALELISSTKGVVSITQFKDVFNNFMSRIKQ